MRSTFAFLAAAAVVLACGCAPTPPPNWAAGGARLELAAARWSRGDGPVELRADGKVLIDGDTAFAIDAAGRVFESDGEPIAVLQPDGHLVGPDNRALGYVGPVSATFPGSDRAWFSIGTRGDVVRYDSDGDHAQDGVWAGCAGAVQRACTLVTHVIMVQEYRRRPRVGIGFGVGVGIPIR